MSAQQAPFASVYNPLQSPSVEARGRHSPGALSSQVRVGPEQLKHAAQACPKSPVEVEVPGLKVLHVQFSPAALFAEQHHGFPAGADLLHQP